MARDMVALMEHLGFPRFAVAGHDRGGRVAYRLALDHPERVDRLAVLDIVPTGERWAAPTLDFAMAYWPWSLLAQPAPMPERLIAADPEAVVDGALPGGVRPAVFSARGAPGVHRSAARPRHAHAICEEYRAGAMLDPARTSRDRARGSRTACPVLALWGAGGALDTWYAEVGGPLALWRNWAVDVCGRAIAGGHFFPEQNPAETIAELRAFLA